MDKERRTHVITDQSHMLHSRADFALDALFVHTAEQKKSQVRRSVQNCSLLQALASRGVPPAFDWLNQTKVA